MIRIGLTGSIAMGKSTAARMFADFGVPVHDSDAAVHRLYAAGGAAVDPMRALAPSAIFDGAVDRGELRALIKQDAGLLKKIEAIVHPLVTQDRENFVRKAHEDDAKCVLFDIPLLFETGAEKLVDLVVVVSAPAEIQRARALSRKGATVEAFEAILAKQTPDSEKRRRADYVIETDGPLPQTRQKVRRVLDEILAKG